MNQLELPEAKCELVEPTGQLTVMELITLLEKYPADQPVFLEIETTAKSLASRPATGVREEA